MCGVCGDPFTDPHPQNNANTGLYGTGIIAHTYKPGQVVEVGVLLTANHLGTFSYRLVHNCVHDLILYIIHRFFNIFQSMCFTRCEFS